MTKKHYEAIAAALCNAKPLDYGSTFSNSRLATWKYTCECICANIKQFNTAFDEKKFFIACGYSVMSS